jgi:hypothetical protein
VASYRTSFIATLLAFALLAGCAPTAPTRHIVDPPWTPTTYTPPPDYQRLFDSLGDACYPGDQFPAKVARSQPTSLPVSQPDLSQLGLIGITSPARSGFLASKGFRPTALFQAASQVPQPTKKRAVSSAEDLSLLSDIEFAKFKDGELIVIGPPATEGQAFRTDDWYVVFRAIAGTEAPGVTIDPGPNPQLMQVRYFGGIERTAIGNTFFQADRTLKLFSTGYDNLTCKVWPERPENVPTELDLITAEMGDGSSPMQGEGRWHRFWFEPNENPIETEGSAVRIPKDRLVVKDESIPAGLPSMRSAREFASAITTNFLGMSNRIRSFGDLQRDAALVILAKWMRDKNFPADAGWINAAASPEETTATTPSITVLRAKLTDRFYLRYGIHGGVDFQKDNRYGSASTQMRSLSTAADQTERTDEASWDFKYDTHPYRAVRLKIPNPVQLQPRWVAWQRVVTRELVQPGVFRIVVPEANFNVTNRTGGRLALQFFGPVSRSEEVKAGQDPAALRVVPGFYRLNASAQCGTVDETVTVREGARYELRYECVSVTGVPAFLKGAVPLDASGGGSFEVVNGTGAAVSVVVAGQLYTVAPGTFTIPLPAGNFTAKVSATCGVATESLNIRPGSVFTGTYTCHPVFR